MSAALEPRGATPRWRRTKRDKGAPTIPPASRDAALDGPSEAHRTDATVDRARSRARRGREAPDAPADARVDGTEPIAHVDSREGTPAGPLSASELTASSCSSASEDGDGSAAVGVSAATETRGETSSREPAGESVARRRKRAASDEGSDAASVATASNGHDEWPAVGALGADGVIQEGHARAPTADTNWRCAGDWPCGACARANSGWRARCARCGAEKNRPGERGARGATDSASDASFVAGSNLSARGTPFPPRVQTETARVDETRRRRDGPPGKTTTTTTESVRRAAAEGFPGDAPPDFPPPNASSTLGRSGAFADAPPDAIPLEALERALAETAAKADTQRPTETAERTRPGASADAVAATTPFRWRDEADAEEDVPLPPLPWATSPTSVPGDGDAVSPEAAPGDVDAPDEQHTQPTRRAESCSVVSALREALRLERDARAAAVRAGVAVAREQDLDALRRLAENVAAHASARVAADLEARLERDAAAAGRSRAELEGRLAEAETAAARCAASCAALAARAERLERGLEEMRARHEMSASNAASSEETTTDAAAQTQWTEPIAQPRVERGSVLRRAARPPARTSARGEGDDAGNGDDDEKKGEGSVFLAKRTRSGRANDDDHGIYVEAQAVHAFGDAASFDATTRDTDREAGAGTKEAAKHTKEARQKSARADARTARAARKGRTKKPSAAKNSVSTRDEETCEVASVAEEIRAQDVAARERLFRELLRARKTKVSFANALDAKNALPAPNTWARPGGFFDASRARGVLSSFTKRRCPVIGV